MKIGIIGAIEEEIKLLMEEIEILSEETIGKRTYYKGSLFGRQIILVYSRCGKVAAASTVTTLIQHYGVDLVLFTGVAGGGNSERKIGDVVIAKKLVQHDMDSTGIPGALRFEIPLLKKIYFETEPPLLKKAKESAEHYINHQLEKELDLKLLKEFNITVPKVVVGTIASGDQFISDRNKINALNSQIEDLQCVEMEGAAVAQICYEYGVSFVVFRVISDNADENAHYNIKRFLEKTAGYFTRGIIKQLISELG
ncbi:5'-methylthioadenosine/adenosylhomocysteine nucleosidase [Anaerocolumna sedimenticola]|uniref:adenosylhomocysteine nucleosidase n=1 Tax=Anaerocolumna sedimenticola TaxID=2696063 RepID=A0A6P1TIR7_9FIRM|nr:5'-methylthioadenosine/adenosylhomocysteine nucleosidase [Anaerocolumna sedimenticola]QHQ59992.1 5'-methylthioadenosine/adenosylhomocysteine nucleosidase [Anaerocolumna sedimenticola]